MLTQWTAAHWESVSVGNFKYSVVPFLRRKVEEGNSPATWMLRRMTYRDYIHAWRVASLGRLGIDPSGSEEQAFSKLQPLCDFNVDYDSEEDFRELLELMDRAGTHFWDIDYARLSLFVRRGWDESGWWYRLVLMTHGDAMESALLAALALDEAGIPHVTIEELKDKAYALVGRPDDLEWEDKVVAVLEARDGTILDVVRKIKPYTVDEA